MAQYRVFLITGASGSITVEADSEDEAVDLAYDTMPHGVCARCGGWGQPWSLDLGEWELDEQDAVTLLDDDGS